MAQVADGLARAHANGIVHPVLKSDKHHGRPWRLREILDFGIAKLIERQTRQPRREHRAAPCSARQRHVAGTGRGTHGRSPLDIFSFGCVLYAAFQGRSPFERDSSVKTMHAVINDDPLPEGRSCAAHRAPLPEQGSRRAISVDQGCCVRSSRGLAEINIGRTKPQRAWLILAGLSLP